MYFLLEWEPFSLLHIHILLTVTYNDHIPLGGRATHWLESHKMPSTAAWQSNINPDTQCYFTIISSFPKQCLQYTPINKCTIGINIFSLYLFPEYISLWKPSHNQKNRNSQLATRAQCRICSAIIEVQRDVVADPAPGSNNTFTMPNSISLEWKWQQNTTGKKYKYLHNIKLSYKTTSMSLDRQKDRKWL